MLKHISNEIKRINAAEAHLGDIMLIDDNLVAAFGNLIIMEGGEDTLFNDNANSYLNFCFVVFEGVETITFDYDMSRHIPLEKSNCYGGVNYLTGDNSEFWISFKSGKILLTEQSEFRKIHTFFDREGMESLFEQKPSTKEFLRNLGVVK